MGWEKTKSKIPNATITKGKGGLALPCLRNYYRAAQIQPMVGWCTPNYISRWKEIEMSMGKELSVAPLVGDPSLTNYLLDPNNPWITTPVKIWNEIIKKYQLRRKSDLLKWFAYDSEFRPNNYDIRFKKWTKNGLTAYCTLLDRCTVMSFLDLKDRFDLQNQDHFRYLQIRDFFIKKIPSEVISGEEEILNIFQGAYKNANLQKLISKLYSGLQILKSDHTLDIKAR